MLMPLFKYRDLLAMLVVRDIRVRYKQAAMGFMWAIFMPMVAVLAGIIVKKAMAVISGGDLELLGIVSMSVKILPWTFFSSAIRFSVSSLVSNSNLVTKIYFPREVLPLGAILACTFDFLVAILVLCVLLTMAQVGVSIQLLWLPFIFLMLFCLTAGLGFLLAAANLFFRDVKYIVEIILTFGIFFTPVFYSSDELGQYGIFMLLNPIGSILESISQVVVLKQAPDMLWLLYSSVCSIAIFIFGFIIFKKKESVFAENI